MREIEEVLRELRQIEHEQGIDHTKGLPEPLFIYASTLMPVANIDLFITNDVGEVLLAWRDDEFCGAGWHIPGGCIRIRETIEERIQRTAIKEIGCIVKYDKNPIAVRESFAEENRPLLEDQLERSHSISLLYSARLSGDYSINNGKLTEHDVGYLRWFSKVPEDLLLAHRRLYGDILKKHFDNIEDRLYSILCI